MGLVEWLQEAPKMTADQYPFANRPQNTPRTYGKDEKVIKRVEFRDPLQVKTDLPQAKTDPPQ